MEKEIVNVDIKTVTFKQVKDLTEDLIAEGKDISVEDLAKFDAYESKVYTFWHKIRNFNKQMRASESLLEEEVDRLLAARQITDVEILDDNGSKTTIKAAVYEQKAIDREVALNELGIDLSQTFNSLDEDGNPVYVDNSGKPVPDIFKRMPLPPISPSKYEAAIDAGMVEGKGLHKQKVVQQHIDTYLGGN